MFQSRSNYLTSFKSKGHLERKIIIYFVYGRPMAYTLSSLHTYMFFKFESFRLEVVISFGVGSFLNSLKYFSPYTVTFSSNLILTSSFDCMKTKKRIIKTLA